MPMIHREIHVSDFEMGVISSHPLGTFKPDLPIILLIHGFPLTSRLWKPQVQGLANVASLIAPDLRNHGSSKLPPKFTGSYTITIENFADDCITLLENIGISHPIVIGGLSMGGYVALALYRKYPERVRAMILAATRAGADSPETRVNRNKSIQSIKVNGRQTIIDTMLRSLISDETRAKRPKLILDVYRIMQDSVNEDAMIKDLIALRDRPDSTDLLPHVEVPTLIIHGAQDKIIPFAEAENTHKLIPKSSLVQIRSAGHLPNLEQSRAFNQAIRQFLRSLS
jgi:pimeloyl-ACP methyl ester carboxylesterase